MNIKVKITHFLDLTLLLRQCSILVLESLSAGQKIKATFRLSSPGNITRTHTIPNKNKKGANNFTAASALNHSSIVLLTMNEIELVEQERAYSSSISQSVQLCRAISCSNTTLSLPSATSSAISSATSCSSSASTWLASSSSE